MDVERGDGGVGGDEVASGFVEELGLFESVYAGDAEEVGDAREGSTVAYLHTRERRERNF